MTLTITHNAGFFSCCSVRLHDIINYINLNSKIPNNVDSSKQYQWYKLNNKEDITYDYFEHYDNTPNITYTSNINYFEWYQYTNYLNLDYNNIIPIVKKYFSPSNLIIDIIKNIEKKYNLNYDNICVLFYRGNDKNTETLICNYDEYLKYANLIIKNNPDILFLIQSDETEFINYFREKFPTNSFYFKDEIRHMNKCNNTVDILMKENIFEFSKIYLAITIIMSKCKYIICGSGNCSIWIMLYRKNSNNVFQNLNGEWLNVCSTQHNNSNWKFVANENEKVTNIGKHIRYGAEGISWIEIYNNKEKIFKVTNSFFNIDPAPNVKKQLQICTKC